MVVRRVNVCLFLLDWNITIYEPQNQEKQYPPYQYWQFKGTNWHCEVAADDTGQDAMLLFSLTVLQEHIYIFGQCSCFMQINYAIRGWGLIRLIFVCSPLMLYLFKLLFCFWHLKDLKFRFCPTFGTKETITFIVTNIRIIITLYNFEKYLPRN